VFLRVGGGSDAGCCSEGTGTAGHAVGRRRLKVSSRLLSPLTSKVWPVARWSIAYCLSANLMARSGKSRKLTRGNSGGVKKNGARKTVRVPTGQRKLEKVGEFEWSGKTQWKIFFLEKSGKMKNWCRQMSDF